MRSFIQSHPGRSISFLVVLALVLPYLVFATAKQADAQIEVQATWAVIEFENTSGKGGAAVGKAAAESVFNELTKTQKYNLVPPESVTRKMEEMSMTAPITRKEAAVRLGQELQAQTVVGGDVVDWRIVNSGGGKRAEVLLQVWVADTASGLLVNGAGVKGESSVRVGDVTDEALVSAAMAEAAYSAVQTIQSRTLVSATVLNTLFDEATINQGARTGFKKGQEIIVTRGREQVATARVLEVDNDSAVIKVVKQNKGIKPGDKARTIYVPERIEGFGRSGEPKIAKPKRAGNNAWLVSLVLVIGVAAFLFSQGRGGNQDVITGVVAEAIMLPDDTPGVQISWRPDPFIKGNQQRFRWQIWRSDVFDTPVIVTDGYNTRVVDDGRARPITWYNFGGIVGTTNSCTFTAPPGETDSDIPGVISGTPYTYAVELVYKLNANDLGLTGGSSGTTTGTTTGGNTGGLTTGGNTGGLTTGGTTGGITGRTAEASDSIIPGVEEATMEMMQTTGTTATTGTTTAGTGATTECYFVSPRTPARGQATPFFRPTLRAPENGAIVSVPTPFFFDSVKGGINSVVITYVLQFSPDPTFPSNKTKEVATLTDNSAAGSRLSTAPVDVSAFFQGSEFVYWRIGARNVADYPGPVDLGNNSRYIFSAPFRFQRPTVPPGPFLW